MTHISIDFVSGLPPSNDHTAILSSKDITSLVLIHIFILHKFHYGCLQFTFLVDGLSTGFSFPTQVSLGDSTRRQGLHSIAWFLESFHLVLAVIGLEYHPENNEILSYWIITCPVCFWISASSFLSQERKRFPAPQPKPLSSAPFKPS